jgi:predicted lipid carrier protein YhbT
MASFPPALTGHDTAPPVVLRGNAASQVMRLLRPVLARLPVRPLQMVSSRLVAKVFHRHPSLAERLRELGKTRILVEATDLPVAFLITPGVNPPGIRVLRCHQVSSPIEARIRGSLKDLIELVEGKADGDALFFSRQIEIEGETEVVVLLRNVLEGGYIDLRKETLATFGFSEPMIERAIRHADMVASKLAWLGRNRRETGRMVSQMEARDE